MELTKEQAINEHRKMWNWIADKYKNGRKESISDLKREYCDKNNLSIYSDCFCCEYDSKHDNNDLSKLCKNCPIRWGSEGYVDNRYCLDRFEINDDGGLYMRASMHSNNEHYKRAEELARKIANLPERK